MVILKIYLEEQLLKKNSLIKHLILLKMLNKMEIKEVLLKWSIHLKKNKKTFGSCIETRICIVKN